MILRRLDEGEFPPHFLYGATKLGGHGISLVWHKSRLGLPRWRMMLRNAWVMLRRYREYDAVYATHYRGIEIIVFLRALRLFRKPVIVWHHQPIITPENRWREWLGRIFYKGFDRMFFFSEQLIETSLASRKADPNRMLLGHWGMDIPEWGWKEMPDGTLFISSGKEMRDMRTLVDAFGITGERLDILVNERNGDIDYKSLFAQLDVRPNIRIEFQTQLAPYEIARRVARAGCVCICCLPTKYTVGLTTLVEALALGKPVICSRNPQFPFSVDDEGCGISVPYGDVEAWAAAIKRIVAHPDEAAAMGRKARQLALTRYNDRICAEEVARAIRDCLA